MAGERGASRNVVSISRCPRNSSHPQRLTWGSCSYRTTRAITGRLKKVDRAGEADRTPFSAGAENERYDIPAELILGGRRAVAILGGPVLARRRFARSGRAEGMNLLPVARPAPLVRSPLILQGTVQQDDGVRMGPTLEAPVHREPYRPRVAQELDELFRNQKSPASPAGGLLQHLGILEANDSGRKFRHTFLLSKGSAGSLMEEEKNRSTDSSRRFALFTHRTRTRMCMGQPSYDPAYRNASH